MQKSHHLHIKQSFSTMLRHCPRCVTHNSFQTISRFHPCIHTFRDIVKWQNYVRVIIWFPSAALPTAWSYFVMEKFRIRKLCVCALRKGCLPKGFNLAFAQLLNASKCGWLKNASLQFMIFTLMEMIFYRLTRQKCRVR